MSFFNPYSLEGKTILISGASSGIGRATAIAASKMGAAVVITARDENRLKETFDSLEHADNRAHKMIIADLTNPDQLDYLIAETPSIDGLVLCAGKGLTLPIQFATREKFDDIFSINFFAPVELMRLLYKKKKIAKNASLVLLSSLGIRGSETLPVGTIWETRRYCICSNLFALRCLFLGYGSSIGT